MNWQLELKRAEIVIGRLIVTKIDQPWFICRFEPMPEFVEIKLYFDALDEDDAGSEEFCQADEAIQALGLELVTMNDKFDGDRDRITDFLMYIAGNEARFRY